MTFKELASLLFWTLGFTMGLFLFILFCIPRTHAEESPMLIGCINTKTYKTVPMTATGNCFLGKNWQDIRIPTSEQMKVWKELFTDGEIINRLPIPNFESSFNEHAGNKLAYGYVQTLRAYKIGHDIVSQLKWMKTRMESQKKGNCSKNKTEENMIKCLYARHFGAKSKNHWYVKKAFAARGFYKWYYSKNPF